MPTLKPTHPRDPGDRRPPWCFVEEQLSNMLLAAMEHAKSRDVTWKDGVPVVVEIPGVLRFQVLDIEFARRARTYPNLPEDERNVLEWEKWLRERMESKRRTA